MSDDEQPRLKKPRAFISAKERQRERAEWAALPPEERSRRLWEQKEQIRQQQRDRASEELLRLMESGRVQAGIMSMAKWWTSRRNISRLKKRAEAGEKNAVWVFSEATRLAVQLAIALGAAQAVPEPGRKIRVRTRFATEAEKSGGPFHGEPAKVTVRMARPGEDEEE